MLYSINGEKFIKTIPYQEEFDKMRNKMSNHEYDAIYRELNTLISGDKIHTSSWIPGSNWSGTVYAPIYQAANQDEELAAKYFGLILWVVVIEHHDTWSSGHYEKDGIPIKGRTYFRVKL